MNKNYIAIIIVIIIAGGLLTYYAMNKQESTTTTNNTTPQTSSPATTLTLPLGPGSKVSMNVTTYTYVGPAENETQNTTQFNTTVEFTVTGYDWPFMNATVTYRGNTTNQTLPIFVFEVPTEYLGKDSFNAPLSLPAINEGLCIKLNLTKKLGNTYIYEGKSKLFNYMITINVTYDSNGIVKFIVFNIKSISFINNNIVNITNIINITSYNISKPSEVSVPSDWICDPPISSHLWFTWEGIYKLNNCNITETTLVDLRNEMQNKSIVIFLNKGCPHCINTWPNILKALRETCHNENIPIYIVIFGGFINQTTDTYLKNTMLQSGITGYPAIAYYEKGFARDKLLGERSAEEIKMFIEKYAVLGGHS